MILVVVGEDIFAQGIIGRDGRFRLGKVDFEGVLGAGLQKQACRDQGEKENLFHDKIGIYRDRFNG